MELRKLSYIWGKAERTNDKLWSPLVLHLIDVAACADSILDREPLSSREHLSDLMGLTWDQAKSWILFLVACHDIGKACPGFQVKWIGGRKLMSKAGLRAPPGVDDKVKHGQVSQLVLHKFLLEKGWPDSLAKKVADAIGCHHGARSASISLYYLEGNRKALGDVQWADQRQELMQALYQLFSPGEPPRKMELSGPDFMRLAGLTSFADWIGSSFDFGSETDTQNLKLWLAQRKDHANRALDSIGWNLRHPLASHKHGFKDLFPKHTPRPLQQAMEEIVNSIDIPSVILVEAPMGEGKTEAAFHAHVELQRKLGHRGMYVALPTRATGNAMFLRTLKFLQSFSSSRRLDCQLIHGTTLLNEGFQELRMRSIDGDDRVGAVVASAWFTQKKRGLLSEYGVGTVDQALMAILPVKHQFVRMWGLSNRVVILDEVHAYDAYTGTLILQLIKWLIAQKSSVILLSATLPPETRREIAKTMGQKILEIEPNYPRISVFDPSGVQQVAFESDPKRRLAVDLVPIATDFSSIGKSMLEGIENGGCGLILVNTVQRAQKMYSSLPDGEPIERSGSIVGKMLADGTEVFLFHARFPADQRELREKLILEMLGPDRNRNGRKVLIATQVVEQSLDLDFDIMISDLAPIDLLLQRSGRLWRHSQERRPVKRPRLCVAGLDSEAPPSFGKPLWWEGVYCSDILLKTWILLKQRDTIRLPEDIDYLVQAVYEGFVEIPPELQSRMDCALASEGDRMAYRQMAYQEHIGDPNDASWDDPHRYLKCDDDDPRNHPAVIAQTRMGRMSLTVIPVFPEWIEVTKTSPDDSTRRRIYARNVSVSRSSVVKSLLSQGPCQAWYECALLRNCYVMNLDNQGFWVEDHRVRLDDTLGLVYEEKTK